jgi:GNAT superfamily N-acetyltransferase
MRPIHPEARDDAVVGIDIESGEGDRDLAERLATEIYAFNAETTGLRDGRLLTLKATQDGVLVAGLSGWTWGSCGFVDALWVEVGSRRRGLGTSLMDTAEQQMALRGCRQVVLLTHSFQAPDFYARRGYARVADVPDYPAGHAWLLFTTPL